MSSATFMEKHPRKFDDHWMAERQRSRDSFGKFPMQVLCGLG